MYLSDAPLTFAQQQQAQQQAFAQQQQAQQQAANQQLAVQRLQQQGQAQQAVQETARMMAAGHQQSIQSMTGSVAEAARAMSERSNSWSVPVYQQTGGSGIGLAIGISVGVVALLGLSVFLLRPKY